MRRLFLALAVLLGCVRALPADDLSDGYQALERGDYGAALRLFNDLAAAGDADAMVALGHMHADGLGVSADVGKAADFYAAGAERGNPYAQSALGYAYDFALGVPHDPAQAERLYRQAADQGLLMAKNNLAFSWSETGRNLTEALALIQEVVAATPEQAAYLDTLGWILHQLDRDAEAVAPLCRAALLEPGSPEIAVHLGDAFWLAGFAAQARGEWSRAVELADAPWLLSESGAHYMGVQDGAAWRAMLEARLRDGIPGSPAAEAAMSDECARPTS